MANQASTTKATSTRPPRLQTRKDSALLIDPVLSGDMAEGLRRQAEQLEQDASTAAEHLNSESMAADFRERAQQLGAIADAIEACDLTVVLS